MTLHDFFFDLDTVLDFIFNSWSWVWHLITTNWIVMMSFCVSILSLIVWLIRRIRNIKP